MATNRVPKINQINIVGNLTNDPTFHITRQTNAMVANFRIAWSEKYYTQGGGQKSRSCFINVSAWLKLAELCKKYLEKGDKVYIEGKLISRNYDSDGKQNSIIEILAQRIEFLTIKNFKDQPNKNEDDE